MKVAVLGTGYVGLVSGVCLAARGHDVTCLDIDERVVERLNRGEPHIHERGLPELLAQVVRDGLFRARVASVEALQGHPIVLIAVGTPSSEGRIDLAQVRSAARLVGAYAASAPDPISVVVKSTVVPGTTDTVVRGILDETAGSAGKRYGLGMNPEFLREGEAVGDFMHPDRIVLGHEDPLTLDRLRELYAPWDATKLEVNTRTAEMIKYVNNCLLATQISAINELANVASALGGIDVRAMLEGVHMDGRWNPIAPNGARVNPGILKYLIPGGGFGGSCFPKDVQAMRTLGKSLEEPMQLLQAVLDVNDRQPGAAVRILERDFGTLQGRSILVLGLAFKAGTDDVRESPAINLAKQLIERGARIAVHDPIVDAAAVKALFGPSARFVADWRNEIAGADAVVVATGWPEYLELREPKWREPLRGKILFDTRSVFAARDFDSARYRCIGG